MSLENQKKLSADLVSFYRKNPCIAAEDILVRDGEPLYLMKAQKVVLEDWWRCKFAITTASRGYGKTFMSAVFLALKAILYPGTRIGILAPSFRQAKLIFAEFERFYYDSPILRREISKPPTYRSDASICEFKKIPGYSNSVVMALPLGTSGDKIRGARFHLLLLDEAAKIPEHIFTAVIKPMLSTASNPAKRVKQIKALRESGATDEEIKNYMLESGNGFYAVTSAYYKFNYWWKQIESFLDEIEKGNPAYAVHFVPYDMIEEGFQEPHIIENAMLNDPPHIFRMEWGAQWESDSAGVFKMSVLERLRSYDCIPTRNGDADKEYYVGIDPAREGDALAVVILEGGNPGKIVHIEEHFGTDWPTIARHLLRLFTRFNIRGIYMDAGSGGGGLTLRDLFADEKFCSDINVMPILETDVPYAIGIGKRVLTMCKPHSSTNSEHVEAALVVVEGGWVAFPASGDRENEDTGSITNYEILSKRRGSSEKDKGREINLVDEMLKQMSAVVATPTAGGKISYDLPKNQAASNADAKMELDLPKKDLYSAFILAVKAYYDLEFLPKRDIITYASGVIKTLNTRFSKTPAQEIMPRQNPNDYTLSTEKVFKEKLTKSGGYRKTTPWGVVSVRGYGKRQKKR